MKSRTSDLPTLSASACCSIYTVTDREREARGCCEQPRLLKARLRLEPSSANEAYACFIQSYYKVYSS
jgi:hypothetical protein